MHFSEKQKQQVEELCGASIRALTGLCELHHRGKTLFLAGKRISFGALHLQPDPLESDFRSHRGAADGIALRLKHSDQDLHLAALHRDCVDGRSQSYPSQHLSGSALTKSHASSRP